VYVLTDFVGGLRHVGKYFMKMLHKNEVDAGQTKKVIWIGNTSLYYELFESKKTDPPLPKKFHDTIDSI
jgi:hypothetical protein